MSIDIYLLPLQPADSFEVAEVVLASLECNAEAGPHVDIRDAAEVIIRMDGRYTPFEKDYVAIAAFENTTEEEARRRYDHVELNGVATNGAPLAQMIFYRKWAVISWYSGTTADELDRYVIAICASTGLAAVDPQARTVWRLQPDGTLA
ncbi:MAG TPA: hypothetical protein VFW33_10580 [Gemmataceae bacterium]|nr:hypothetical protein [Gemmataceae bacterium]